MNELFLPASVLLPVVAGVLALLCRGALARLAGPLAILATAAGAALAAAMFGNSATWSIEHWGGVWSLGGKSIEFALTLRLDHFASFIVAASAGFGVLICLYSWRFMAGKPRANQFYAYLLLSLAMVNGAVLCDNLVAMLFFWEGLLATLFGMIAIGRPGAWKTATKAFILVGISDLCLMLGIALAADNAGTLSMSKLAQGPIAVASFAAGLSFVLMMIGATAKAGAMPFHSWIPDAAVDAPLPFMAILPAALEKLLGIYLLSRIALDLFRLAPGSWMSTLLMTLGCVTILLAVAMALIQKDYKRLLSYHAISQVGYMILGIGTAVPLGIAGGIFHMINHAMYKSCLFLTGGSVEHVAGTTDLSKLGGLARKMPVTFACFFVAAASISGVPPFNGFFSKELVYDGALHNGMVFYVAAILGSFLTAASFLKLGHAAYFGKGGEASGKVKEAPLTMLVPMVVIAGLCVLFGVYNALPLHNLIVPVLTGSAFGREWAGEIAASHFAGWPESMTLVVVTVAVLLAAVANHLIGAKRAGSGLGAADHIHYAPVLKPIYAAAERRWFDPYEIGRLVGLAGAAVLWAVDRIIDWVFNRLVVGVTYLLTLSVRLAHGGSYATYVVYAAMGAAALIGFLMIR
jgi:NADH-quinone oxidoreductase subunit L